MKITLQEHYNKIKKGKGSKELFIKEVKSQFPKIFLTNSNFDSIISELKKYKIISDSDKNVEKESNLDFFKLFKESLEPDIKTKRKKPHDTVSDKIGFDVNNKENLDNIYGHQFLIGFYAEMRDPKNTEKTVDELKEIVAKNLKSNSLYYIEDGVFGVKGLGYVTELPGLGTPKEPKGPHKSSGYGSLSEQKSKTSLKNLLKEATDYNDPVLMKLRADKYKRSKPKQKEIPYEIQKEIEELERERKQIFRDMEQEAELEGGPISDYYGELLDDVDKKIQKLRNFYLKEDIDDDVEPVLDAYNEGFDAQQKGIPLNKNPYPKKTTNYNKWIKGWEESYHLTTVDVLDDEDDLMFEKDSLKLGSIHKSLKEFENKSKFRRRHDDFGFSRYNSQFQACIIAKKISKEEGVIQHVHEYDDYYEVSDWYDDETTICSFEDGVLLENKNLINESLETSGLIVTPTSEHDQEKLNVWLEDGDFYGEYNDIENYYFFPELPENHDSLEYELQKEFEALNINVNFEAHIIDEEGDEQMLEEHHTEHKEELPEKAFEFIELIADKYGKGSPTYEDVENILFNSIIDGYHTIWLAADGVKEIGELLESIGAFDDEEVEDGYHDLTLIVQQ